MTNPNHIIDIAEAAAHLRTRDGVLQVVREQAVVGSVPLREVAAVIAAHAQVTVTRGVLSGLAEAGAAFLVCDDRHMPVGLMLPLTGYHAPARRFAAQAAASGPTRKRLRQQIIRAKIGAQATVLEEQHETDYGLRSLAREVRSGDPTNVEAQAARIYWDVLFDRPEFQRLRSAPDENRYLNYGYAVLRAMVGRAICGSGLHPGLGLFHHHRNNPFCLADDLMEPLRPLVDRAVLGVVDRHGPDAPMSPALKRELVEWINADLEIAGEKRSPFDVAARMSASLAAVFEGTADRLLLPDL